MTVQHTAQGAGAPTTAPPSLNAHYLDTTSKISYVAVGTASAADWKPTATKEDVQAVADALADKVDAVPGKALSTEDYSTEEKNKLAALEGSHYRGTYLSLAALQAAVPVGNPGDYADVDLGVGEEVTRYVWDADDGVFVDQKAAPTALTAAQAKSLYESNADTNAFTDAEKSKLAALDPGGGGGAEVGDTLITARVPDATYIACDGSIKAQSTYPDLFAAVGLLGGAPTDGMDWAAVTAAIGGNNAVRFVTDGAGRWLGSAGDGRILSSANNGASWLVADINPGSYMETGVAYSAGTWYAYIPGDAEVLRISTDNWASWFDQPVPDFSYTSLRQMAASPNGVVVLAEFGLKISRNNGVTWTYDDTGTLGGSARSVATDGTGLWFLGIDGPSIHRSADDGLTWTAIATGAPADFRWQSIVKAGSRWVIAGYVFGSPSIPGIYYSDDSGLTWTAAAAPVGFTVIDTIVAIGADTLIGCAGAGWFRSDDAALTWQAFVPTGIEPTEKPYTLESDGVTVIGNSNNSDQILVSNGLAPAYDTANSFQLPDLPAPVGLKAYIKAQ